MWKQILLKKGFKKTVKFLGFVHVELFLKWKYQ